MSIIQAIIGTNLTISAGGGGGGGDLSPFVPDVDVSSISTAGWQILMATDGYKTSPVNTQTARFADISTAGFRSANFQSTNAASRLAFGNGYGVYANWFLKTGITKLALVDGTGSLVDPTTNTNYLIYDLVSSTGAETVYDIIRRLDYYLQNNPNLQNNDSVFTDPSVTSFTAGSNGYSGLLNGDGGSVFRDSSGIIPDKIAIMGINRDSDNDIQALCAYRGDLQSGKADSWRGDNPAQSFWSYWGDDFHSDSTQQRPGVQRQTAPGIATGVSAYSGDVYLLAY